jgi:hypothetical protein
MPAPCGCNAAARTSRKSDDRGRIRLKRDALLHDRKPADDLCSQPDAHRSRFARKEPIHLTIKLPNVATTHHSGKKMLCFTTHIQQTTTKHDREFIVDHKFPKYPSPALRHIKRPSRCRILMSGYRNEIAGWCWLGSGVHRVEEVLATLSAKRDRLLMQPADAQG